MTCWRKGISWSKFKMALECPLQLQKAIEKEPAVEWRPSYHIQLGTTVQKVFEMYFNQKINLKPGGQSEEVLARCADKVLASKWFADLRISYPPDRDLTMLKATIHKHVQGGYKQFKEIGVLDKPVRSEVDWGATFRNFRLFGRMDFVVSGENGGVYLYDGKSNHSKSADIKQLLFYALIASVSSRPVLGGGFLYWGIEYVSLDLSPVKIKELIDGPFNEAAVLFEKLKTGVDVLPAKPESNRCYWCTWGRTCKFSVQAREAADHEAPATVSFGEAK